MPAGREPQPEMAFYLILLVTLLNHMSFKGSKRNNFV